MENLIGLTLEEARFQLSVKRVNNRVVRIDGKSMVITDDLNFDRVNLEIENNIVIRIYNG